MRVALIGCGRIAKRHSQLLGENQIAGAELAGVCDIVPERAREIGDQYKVPAFENLYDMMKSVEPNLAVVLTESGNHAKNVIDAAPYGAHVMVEKPMALKLSDADAMIEACDKAGSKLFVIKQNRFNLPVVRLREALVVGRFGKLVMGTVRVRWCRPQAYYDQAPWRGTWAMDGGVLTNQASHHIDLLEWMMGDVVRVSAMTRTALADIEAEDTGIAILEFKNGALGIIEATTATRPKDLEGSISILGELGSVEIGGFAVNEMKTWNFVHPEPEDDIVLERYSVNPPNVYGFGHKAYYDHVVRAIRDGGPNLVDGLEGRKSLELINAIYEAVETSQAVDIRFRPRHSRLGEHPAD
ncbi:MAG: Gfo/Idh/MocA family oxidoreductase [Alphaproteobacteria bacterium]|nr:Gfo/Idh/MocA family oxidoreductase [Alphaproteobacteria bacterium]